MKVCFRLEISEPEGLLREIASRRQPLYSERWTFGKWPFQTSVDVALGALESIRADGPIVIESKLDSTEMRAVVDARVARLYVRSRYVLAGALVKDGTRSLEMSVDGGVKATVELDETAGGSFDLGDVRIDLQGLEIKLHLLPAWMERRLQGPIERALQGAFEQLIGQAVRSNLRHLVVESALESLTSARDPRRAGLSRSSPVRRASTWLVD